jgi:hypothetical protein
MSGKFELLDENDVTMSIYSYPEEAYYYDQ